MGVFGVTLTRHGHRRVAADVETALLVTALIVGVGFLLNPDAAMLAIASVGAGWVVSRIAFRRRNVVVLGSPTFCRAVESLRWRGHRVLATWNVYEDTRPELPAHSDVVIEGRALGAVRRRAPELLALGHEVRVVRGGAADLLSDDPLDYLHRALKRALDVALAVFVLALTLPLLLICMLAVRLDSSGRALFVQTRIGQRGRPFRLYKLRTMKAGDRSSQVAYLQAMTLGTAGPQGGVFKPLDHASITRVGRFLRRFSIDELPQMWNVVKGDMSVVGPRPPMPHEVEVYDSMSWQRLRVKPGLTGLSQVNGRSSLPFDQIVALDVEYAEHWSPSLDLRILAKTPMVVFTARGAA